MINFYKDRFVFFSILFSFLSLACSENKQLTEDLTAKSRVLTLKTITAKDAGVGEPFLYTDHNGKTFLSWIEKGESISRLKYAVLENEHWSDPILIAEGDNWFVNWADYPQFSSFQDGSLAAFFLEKSGAGPYAYDIKMSISRDGKSWQKPFVLHDDGTETEHGFASMVPWGEDLFVSWLDGRNTVSEQANEGGHDHGHGGAMTLRGARITVTGKKTAEWELDDRVCDCCQTSAILTDSGPLVVFRDRTGAEFRDLGMVRFVKDEWTGTLPVFNDFWKVPGCPVNGPRADATGNVSAVAWYSGANDKPEVKVSFSTDGGESFQNPIKIDLGNTIGRVDLIMLNDSTVMVSWMEGSDIYARKVFASGVLGEVIPVATSTEKRSGGFPQMVKNGNSIILAWTDEKEGTAFIKTGLLILE